jgi:ATP-dependent NAD(P)H-hydrate dehydratase
VYCAEEAATPLKSYSPELMVTPMYSAKDLSDNASAVDIASAGERAAGRVLAALPRAHSLIIGPGLGRAAVVHDIIYRVVEEARRRHMPIVLDADALFLLSKRMDIVRGYRRCVITPNVNEFRILSTAAVKYLSTDSSLADSVKEPLIAALSKILNATGVEDGKKVSVEDTIAAVRALSKVLDGPAVFLKGANDIISAGGGDLVVVVDRGGGVSPRRCGGQVYICIFFYFFL